jgi:hypothetical protein
MDHKQVYKQVDDWFDCILAEIREKKNKESTSPLPSLANSDTVIPRHIKQLGDLIENVPKQEWSCAQCSLINAGAT